MCTYEQIEEYKLKYSNIYAVNILNVEYIYRTMSIGEFHRVYSASRTDVELEDGIVREALLYPDILLDNILAGIPTILSNCILTSSGIGNISNWDSIVEEKKSRITGSKNPSEDPIIGRIITITEAFKYNPIELYNMDPDQLLELCAWAEIKLQVLSEVMETTTQPQPKKSRIPDIPGNVPQNITKARYTQQELESMSMDTSKDALTKEMKKYARG